MDIVNSYFSSEAEEAMRVLMVRSVHKSKKLFGFFYLMLPNTLK
jgi:hypothetical protein